jgi:hypothetical protein
MEKPETSVLAVHASNTLRKQTLTANYILSSNIPWAGNFNIDGKSVFSSIGVRFTEISFEDRELISALDQNI